MVLYPVIVVVLTTGDDPTVALAVPVFPKLSVTVTVYTPAAKLTASSVV